MLGVYHRDNTAARVPLHEAVCYRRADQARTDSPAGPRLKGDYRIFIEKLAYFYKAV